MGEVREMTIARGLTRIKTIKAQLNNISVQIQQYSAWNNKTRHPFGENKGELKDNHNQSVEKVKSLLQQHRDLVAEFTKIVNAINKANMETAITIGDKTMTINEALIYKRNIEPYMHSLMNAWNRSVANARTDVDRYNQKFNALTDEDTRKAVMSDVLYLIRPEQMKETEDFLVTFVNEIDGTLNEINALTKIEIE